jgi:hypothetical protein
VLSTRCQWFWLAALAGLALAGCETRQPAQAGWKDVCIDADGDGHGFQCSAGPDCDDDDAEQQADCESSRRTPRTGGACEPAAQPVDCQLPYEVTVEGALLCATGTRYCRDGAWSGCEGIRSFTVPPSSRALAQALLDADAAHVTCSPCRPDCYRVDDDVALDGGAAGGLTSGANGGITLVSEAQDAGAPEGGLLDEVRCTPGVAPDFDCDGIPDDFDPYPGDPPFATDHRTLFMDLGPGESATQSFDIQFYVNTADVYFYVDMTGSMEGERDNLIASLTSGNYLPNAGAGIECADRDFDGRPDDALKNGGIAGNIACLIRDSRLGAGWFRDIPFEGPYANGIRVASTDFEMFEHRQDITNDVGAVRSALSGFETRGNQNAPEGSMQGLWSLVTGEQLYAGWTRPGIPPRRGCPDGTWGYACFRAEAVPIVIHIGDAPLQNGPSPTSASRAGYLSDCVEQCSCVRESCRFGFCYCVEQRCSCEDAGRHPLDYDAQVVAGLRGGTEAAYRALDTSAEALATAQNVGAIDDVLLTYTGDTARMTRDLGFAALGPCPSGTAAWRTTSEGAPDAVFRFNVRTSKTLTISTRGSRFDTTLLVKRIGSSTVLDCNNDLSSSDSDSEITRTFSPGDYYAILKGRTAGAAGWFQLTLGDKTKQTTAAFAPKRWLGPNGDGPGGVRDALLARGVRVISVNSSDDAYLAEQTQVLSRATGALDTAGQPLTFSIRSDGSGMGAAVIDAVNLLAGNLAMDVSVVLREEPDAPSPRFVFKAEAIDTPGDLCDPPVDRDGDPLHTPDTHLRCRPGAAPRFQVTFGNPATPNHVPRNANDPNGGYNMRLELIGDGVYEVDRIPVYIIPEDVIPEPPTQLYAASGSYEQSTAALACVNNEAPVWSTLSWSAELPDGTALRWELCSADSELALTDCALRSVAEVRGRGTCDDGADCPGGSCSEQGVCMYITGPACSGSEDCGADGQCVSQRCQWPTDPIDVRHLIGAAQQGRDFMRVRTTLLASPDRGAAPTLFDWRIDYTCSAQE